ncbi:DUF1501 domain-containing protein [Tuwongella immobilis]|uniref:DUF1501 domain-containing protein n=1 Tax=Tuwongella immobilis TaxID=692036 RepID=A0A6C2YRQ3_9BACT|nr:DUF1501 domain-containing protein [Tuwongella immobilis]VIP04014.1 protein containing duf1501 : Uncharacterized protein OS=Singulisphaera acidiphila (strain ATCC BAA-1392 / DSM 18658 / VKM B-2454 / MOB10) GN=Sinac_3304 PE=4 SV=1: DUF1501 [Tuwongella immobilis]VTS05395.1 protein containing duf1501 : Uncharacterized protein OS=Singulisphaera acidiphila (strain ATCC BAA-1392 / DSM 18658 / VKM B-2454 / MOB10) GN=Sinac_3304 PE=4 SV=1: DUF1501 [Tuwongella immobilis]
MAAPRTNCAGQTRRDWLRMGSFGLFGAGWSMDRLLAAEVSASAAVSASSGGSGQPGGDVSLIYLFLHGGLSTIDTFDLKPNAPSEFAGPFKPMATATPGMQIVDQLPALAAQSRHFSLIRSFRHANSDHGPADHYMFTGYLPQPGFNANLTPNNQRPSIGSILSKLQGPRGSVPPYVCLPQIHPSTGAAYLGATAAPFGIDADPNSPNFAVRDVLPPLTLPADRLQARRELLTQVDRFQKSAEMAANRHAQSVGVFRQKAFELMTSPAAKQAFDIHAEPAKLRDEYGRHSLGQSCLMARRLVEAGVRCVTIDHSNWDTHDNNFRVLQETLLPQLNTALAALFRDLADRGMLRKTLVVVTGEFGRTPRINKNAGRDHWGPSFTVLVGGGGLAGGTIVGASDARAERPITDPIGPEDLMATIVSCLGLNPREEFITPDGRPVSVVNNGRPIRQLL